MFITVFTEHVITPKLVLNGIGEFVANFLLIFHVHVYNQSVDLQVLQGEKYLGVECYIILVSLHE